MRFLRTDYARDMAGQPTKLSREVSFVLSIENARGRAVTLRGSMDLVVLWPDGAVDVVDPGAPRLRAGLAFLGGAGMAEPVWRELSSERELRGRIGDLGERLVAARWSEVFPRVAIDRCEAIHCGFIGRCHPERPRD
jgi:hypothetical protein